MGDIPAQRSFTRLVLAIVVAAVVVSASVLSYGILRPASTTTTTATSTLMQVSTTTILQTTTRSQTVTLVNFPSTTNVTPQRSQRVSVLNSIWNFTASISADEVTPSGGLFVTASLTNISPADQTIAALVQPTIYPSVYASNGSLVWSWTPPQSTWPNYTVGRGQSLGASISVPTSSLTLGQSYLLKVGPESIPTASNMTATMRFYVGSGAMPPPSKTVSLIRVGGTYYWADDISGDITIGGPGYSYFHNGSVIFDGVRFQTICPAEDQGCPGGNSSSFVTMFAGAIQFNMVFPDGTNETVGDVIGDSIFTYVISQHSPSAGMLIEYVNDYGYPNYLGAGYAVFLLVSSCGGPPHLC